MNNGEKLDISVKTDKGYVSKLVADKNSAGFSVETSDTKVSLLSKQGAGVYYVVVPAGVKISVYNGNEPLYSGDKTMSTTKADGLKAGKYYTLTTGKTTGKEYATINGEKVEKKWVQLWPGGPKFATENVAEMINFTEARKTGDVYVWGANWRTPTVDELNKFFTIKEKDGKHVVSPINTTAKLIEKNGEYGVLLTGVKPGYTGNTLYLPADPTATKEWLFAHYLTSEYYDDGKGNAAVFSYIASVGDTESNIYSSDVSWQSTVTKCFVCPVLVEK